MKTEDYNLLINTIKFYANTESWSCGPVTRDVSSDGNLEIDDSDAEYIEGAGYLGGRGRYGGKLARATLKEVGINND